MVVTVALFLSYPRSMLASLLELDSLKLSERGPITAKEKIKCPYPLKGLAYFFKGRHRLLAASTFMVVFCLVDIGEALRYGNTKGGLDGVLTESFGNVNVEGIKQVC